MKMKEKHYFTQAVGTDSNGVEHKIVVCGVWNQLKEKVEVSNDVVLEFGVRGKILHPKTILCKSFSMGYAICSPEDEFSLEEGKKIALSRAKKKPIGKLGTKWRSHSVLYNFSLYKLCKLPKKSGRALRSSLFQPLSQDGKCDILLHGESVSAAADGAPHVWNSHRAVR